MKDALQQIHDKLDRILAAVEKKKQPKHGMEVRGYDSEVFEWFWRHYPHRNGRKLGKQQALTAFCHNAPIKEYDKFKKAVLNYTQSQEVKDGFAKDPVRFFKNRLWTWRDWIEPADKKLDLEEYMETKKRNSDDKSE